jgi:hypothetical protein
VVDELAVYVTEIVRGEVVFPGYEIGFADGAVGGARRAEEGVFGFRDEELAAECQRIADE